MNRHRHHELPEWLQREADLHRPHCAAARRQRAALIWLTTVMMIGIVIAFAVAELR